MNNLVFFDFLKGRCNDASVLRLLVAVLFTVSRHRNFCTGLIGYLSARRCISRFAFKTECNGFALIRLQTGVSHWSVDEKYSAMRNLSHWDTIGLGSVNLESCIGVQRTFSSLANKNLWILSWNIERSVNAKTLCLFGSLIIRRTFFIPVYRHLKILRKKPCSVQWLAQWLRCNNPHIVIKRQLRDVCSVWIGINAFHRRACFQVID